MFWAETGMPTAVVVWWASLSAVSVLNVCAWAFVALLRPSTVRDSHQTVLSAVFVFTCAYRSFLPRVEASRFCLFDSLVSNSVLSRVAATFAELAFVAQVALLLHACSRAVTARVAQCVACALVPIISIAEVLCWYGAVTGNLLGHVLEESLWATTFALLLVALITLVGRVSHHLRCALYGAMVVVAAYVVFMVTVDVPMYVQRYVRDEAARTAYLSMAEGLRDAWHRRVVTWRWDDWREEVPWMSLYFSGAVWLSVAMMWASRFVARRAQKAE